MLDGSTYDGAALVGKVSVVNFWASWCSACRVEAAEIADTYREFRNSQVAFLGVNFRDSRDAAVAFARAFKMDFPSVYDPKGKVALSFVEFAPDPQPATLILDRQGNVASICNGTIPRGSLAPKIDQVLGER